MSYAYIFFVFVIIALVFLSNFHFSFNSHFTSKYHLLCVNSALNFIASGAQQSTSTLTSTPIYMACLSTHSLNYECLHSTAYAHSAHSSNRQPVNKIEFSPYVVVFVRLHPSTMDKREPKKRQSHTIMMLSSSGCVILWQLY